MKRDVQATEARHFKNPESYVAKDGREVLLGKDDWRDRVIELRVRAEDRCEFVNADSGRCSAYGRIPSHIKPRYPKRDDRLSNLLWQCFYHDRITEKQSWRRIRSDRKEHRSARAQEA